MALLLASAAWPQAGDWIATLEFGASKTRLALHVAAKPRGGFEAAADSIDQDAFGLPVAMRVRGRTVQFDVPKLNGRFSGEMSTDGASIEGEWTQRGGRLPIRFVRGNIRPQEPAPPYPYRSEQVTCRNGNVRLAGTLTLPPTPGPHPAVLLITGSGPQDRNETTSGHRPFLVWSDFLTRRGFVTLRLDDRGVGDSTGRLLDSTDEDFARDALAAVNLLKRRKEVDPRRIGLIGHSEGGVVAPLAALKSRDVAFIVLLAGPSIPGDQVLFAQGERISRVMGVPEELARRNRQIQAELFQIVQTEKRSDIARRRMEQLLARETASVSPEQAAITRGQVGGQIAMASSRWFRFVWTYDPKPALEKMTCPVLALYGSRDLQVPADLDAPVMERALAGNPRATVTTIDGLNHLFQNAHTGSPMEYAQIEETVAPKALDTVAEWLAGIGGVKP
jgi:hypothetical protein